MDIYTESPDVDPDTLRNLGPLAALAGVWEGQGADLHPVAGGDETEGFVEHAEFHPIDPQSNGPQLLYGLRYHLFIRKVGEIETFHDQVGYWLWEPATKTVIQTLAIPRAQVAMASGSVEPDARRFTVRAVLGSPTFGICSGPFLDMHFKTLEYSITITVNPDGTIAYTQDTVMQIPDRDAPFHHTDNGSWRKIGNPQPNPLMRSAI
jgi:hypothetical protein